MTVDVKPYNILLVEDNPLEAELTKASFENADSELGVSIVKTGEEALQYFLYRGDDQANPCEIDLMLLDLKMPKTDGMTVLNILKTNAKCREIPIIILSASTDLADMTASYQSGAACYVSKPVDYGEFSKAIKALVTYWRRVKKGEI